MAEHKERLADQLRAVDDPTLKRQLVDTPSEGDRPERCRDPVRDLHNRGENGSMTSLVSQPDQLWEKSRQISGRLTEQDVVSAQRRMRTKRHSPDAGPAEPLAPCGAATPRFPR
jgi:hypothetical protein